jgi:steroid delta-isomerase-like uncharacterized protein
MGAEQDRNKEAVRRLYQEIWNEGRIDQADQYVHEDFEDHPPTRFWDLNLRGPRALTDAVVQFHAAMPDFHDEPEQIVAEGDRVVYLGQISGTLQGEVFGFPPTGKSMKVWGVNFFRMEDGKVRERWGQFDVLGMVSQLGLAPGPGGEGGPPPADSTD